MWMGGWVDGWVDGWALRTHAPSRAGRLGENWGLAPMDRGQKVIRSYDPCSQSSALQQMRDRGGGPGGQGDGHFGGKQELAAGSTTSKQRHSNGDSSAEQIDQSINHLFCSGLCCSQ